MDFNLITDFMPISDFKKNANEVAARIKETKRPVVITINGRPNMVVSDAESYQATESERDEVVARIRNALAEKEAGKCKPFPKTLDDFYREFDLNGKI